MNNTGVLLVAYGGPRSLDEVAPFMERLTGAPVRPEVLSRIKERYVAIGGKSPLVDFALSISRKLEKHFAQEGSPLIVKAGMLHSEPSIADAVHELIAEGVNQIICISLSPYYSTASNGASFAAAAEVVETYPGVELLVAPEIGLFEPYIRAQAEALEEVFDEVDVLGEEVPIAFVAHSLEESAVLAGDQVYVDGLQAVANSIAEHLFMMKADDEGYMVGEEKAFGTQEIPRPWLIAYSSQGMRGGKWLGPSVSDFIKDAAQKDAGGVVIVPLGFATDHLETLYDLDIKAKEQAEELKLGFVRTRVPNDSEALILACAESINTLRNN